MRATRSLAMVGWAFIGIGLGTGWSHASSATDGGSGVPNVQELQRDL